MRPPPLVSCTPGDDLRDRVGAPVALDSRALSVSVSLTPMRGVIVSAARCGSCEPARRRNAGTGRRRRRPRRAGAPCRSRRRSRRQRRRADLRLRACSAAQPATQPQTRRSAGRGPSSVAARTGSAQAPLRFDPVRVGVAVAVAVPVAVRRSRPRRVGAAPGSAASSSPGRARSSPAPAARRDCSVVPACTTTTIWPMCVASTRDSVVSSSGGESKMMMRSG